MKKLRHCIFGLLILFVSINVELNGQDLHYSQFYNSPQTSNPALTGVFNGDERYMANMRDQWRWVPVPWFTFGASYDRKFYPKKSDNHFFAGGLNLYHDRQGDSRLNLSTLNVSGSYSRILNPQNIITGGMTLGFSSRGFSDTDLTWDKQWDGDTFDPSVLSGENFDTERIYFLETAVGLNYRFQKSKRTKFDLGVGAFHLIRPSAGFYDNEDQKLPININFTAIGSFYIMDILDLQVHGLQQVQDEYRETIIGGLAKIYVNTKRGKEANLHLGMGYRTSGSLIPTIALEYKQYYLGANLDIDGTDFNDIENSRRGAFEVHFRYVITHVKPLKEFKVCPIY
ncbi:MAG: PorP/SprF family type IX secretion system membrane protein [Saprospiraceae bacterium]|nr:PorP/SprF family type IX secretion system membrane protein [Saprospiraceae bacterium]